MTLLEEARLTLADVDQYAVCVGPGTYTGLRIGIASIQGLALAQGKLVTPVSAFEALAFRSNADATGRVAVWIDAHRGEVFAMLYGPDGRVLHEATSLAPGATLDLWEATLEGAPVAFAGDGAVKYRDVIGARLGASARIPADVPPLGGAVGVLAARHPDRAGRPHAVIPLYVRRPDVELTRERRQLADRG
jgi:tRNA threonylcarbamoyladenosine biosynthesis protein TsaB